MIDIKHKTTGEILYHTDSDSLERASLRGLNLSGADLCGGSMFRSDLSGANLSGADLRYADLAYAKLTGANLNGANIAGAALYHADIFGVNLSLADLSQIKADLYNVLDRAHREVTGLLTALRQGDIDGSVYEGDCACLVGTIANLRGCTFDGIIGITPDEDRPAEQWFKLISPGETPFNSQVVAITEQWILEWMQ